MKVVTKEQADALFQLCAALFGDVDGVPISDAAALFGVEAVKYALLHNAGKWHNSYTVDGDRLPYLTYEGFRVAATAHNIRRCRMDKARGAKEVDQEEDRAATVQSSAEQSKDK